MISAVRPATGKHLLTTRLTGFDVVDGARSRHRGAIVIVVDESHEESRPDANYHDRFRYRQERISGSRDRRQGEGSCEEATPAQPGGYVFQGIAAVPDRHGSLCHGALLGARADEARPRGAPDAGEGCEGLR